jgi:transcriptional regulator with AAA-type ATPase domain
VRWRILRPWKLWLLRGLYERGYNREDILLFRFIDWLLVLPATLEQEFWHEVHQFEEDRHMPYVTSTESPRHPTARLVGTCPAIAALRAQLRHLAALIPWAIPLSPRCCFMARPAPAKGLVARVLHASGPRATRPFLDVNCAAIPETLLEAELFGVTAGAFTDARRAKPGLFEAASEGALFLDEIDALPLALQGSC